MPDFSNSQSESRIEELAIINETCDRFEKALREGETPKIDEHLPECSDALRQELLTELTRIQGLYRVDKDGDASAQNSAGTQITSGQDLSTLSHHIPPTSENGRTTPTAFGRYLVRSLLGEGAFGRVWMAFDPELQREVAIKEPKISSAVGDTETNGFLREARRAAQLDHPHIVPVLDVGRTFEGVPFVVSKLIEGTSLKSVIESRRHSTIESLRTVSSIAGALHYAHTQGLIHRDVKPANILIDRQGKAYLTDFGLALLISEQMRSRGEVSGSPAYMSPEQVRGLAHRLDGRSDIWSLGVILYELLTGKRPFAGDTLDDLFDEILTRDPRPPRQFAGLLPRNIEAICLKALSKDVSDRFATADDLRQQLQEEQEERTLPVSPESAQKSVSSRIAFNIPQLPPCYVPRDRHLDSIREMLLTQGSQTIGVTGASMLGVQGRGGLGKTVIAAAIVQDKVIQGRFHHGTIWLSFGQTPGIPSLQRQLLKALGIPDSQFETASEFRDLLLQCLSDQSMLIVLDDVWETDHVRDFILPLDRTCFLITTRDGQVLTRLNATEYELDVLDQPMALRLLADWSSEPVASLKSSVAVEVILKETGRLPLALSVCGAMRRDGISWTDIAQALSESMLDFLDENVHYNYRSVLKCLAVGVEFLQQTSPDDATRYLELAVFSRDATIPEDVVARFWNFTGKLSPLKTRRLITTLQRKNLLSIHEKDSVRLITFHNLQHDYLHGIATHQDRLRQYHQALIDCYRPNDWSISDDGYFYQWIIWHLNELRHTDLCKELLLSVEWLRGKLEACGLREVLNDLNRFYEHPEIRLLSRALRLSSHIISHDTLQLEAQLFARLGSRQLHRMPFTFEAAANNRIVPITASLTGPGRLLQTLKGPKAEPPAFDQIGDQDLLVSCQRDGTVFIWDLISGEQVRTFRGPERRVEWLKTTPDGKLAIFFHDNSGMMEAWDLQSETLVWKFSEHAAPVLDVCFQEGSQRAISCAGDGTVIVWDYSDGRVERVVRPFEAKSAAAPQVVDRFAINNWNLVGFSISIRCVQYLRDVNRIICVGAGRTETSFQIAPDDGLSTIVINHGSQCKAVVVSQSQQLILTGGVDGAIRLWDLHNFEPRGVLDGHQSTVRSLTVNDPVRSLAVNENTNCALSGSYNAKMIHWNLETQQIISEFQGHTGRISKVCFLSSPDVAASASEDGTIKIWDLSLSANASDNDTLEPEAVAPLTDTSDSFNRRVHHGEVCRVLIDPNSGRAFSAGIDGSLFVHDLASGTIEGRVNSSSHAAVRDITLTPAGDHIISIHENGDYRMWSVVMGEYHCRFRNSVSDVRESRWSISRMRWMSSSGNFRSIISDAIKPRFFICDGNGNLYIVSSQSGELLATHFAPTRLRPIFSLHTDSIVTVTHDASILVTDLKNNSEQLLGGHADSITEMQMSTDGQMLITVGADTLLKIWDLRTMTQRGESLQGHDRIVNCCALTSDNSCVLTGGNDGRIVLWDLPGERQIGRMGDNLNPIKRLLLIDKDRKVVSVSQDGTIGLWDLATWRRIGAFTADAEITDLAATATRIIAGDKLGYVHILKISDT
jgi:WD40 repeat protein/serine/threonine protein kinase